jgi:hypothetical protein
MEVYIIHIEFDAGNGNECAILDATMSKDMAKQLFQMQCQDMDLSILLYRMMADL